MLQLEFKRNIKDKDKHKSTQKEQVKKLLTGLKNQGTYKRTI